MANTDDDELRLLIQKVARRIRANRSDERISDSQLSVLVELTRAERTPGELAAMERVTPPSMNRTLNGLASSGLVARTRSTDDGRRVVVTITTEGERLIEETRRLRSEWLTHRIAELPPEDRAALAAAASALRKLAES